MLQLLSESFKSPVGSNLLLVWAFVTIAVLFLCPASGEAQGTSDPATKPIKKCWEVPGAVTADAGLAADQSQGYFVDSRGRLVAVELESGAIAWSADLGGTPASEIALTASSVILASRSGGDGQERQAVTLRSFSRTTGLPIWQVGLAPAGRHHLQLTKAGLVSVAGSGEIRLLKEADGQTIWKASSVTTPISAPQFADGRFHLASEPKRIQEYSIPDGRLNWETSVKSTPSIVVATDGDGSVYIDEKGNVFSIDRKGAPRWKFKAGGRVIFVKAVGDNLLLGSVDNFVYFMSAEYGNLIWKRRLSGRIASGGIIGETKAVFTVVGDRSAFVIELNDGRVVDRISLESDDDAFLLTPIRANGIYLLAATVKSLSAFSANCGNEKSGDAKSPLP